MNIFVFKDVVKVKPCRIQYKLWSIVTCKVEECKPLSDLEVLPLHLRYPDAVDTRVCCGLWQWYSGHTQVLYRDQPVVLVVNLNTPGVYPNHLHSHIFRLFKACTGNLAITQVYVCWKWLICKIIQLVTFIFLDRSWKIYFDTSSRFPLSENAKQFCANKVLIT